MYVSYTRYNIYSAWLLDNNKNINLFKAVIKITAASLYNYVDIIVNKCLNKQLN